MASKLSTFAEMGKQISGSHKEKNNLENAQLNFYCCHNINKQQSPSYLAYIQASSEFIQNKNNTNSK
jgi:hypothetical protein